MCKRKNGLKGIKIPLVKYGYVGGSEINCLVFEREWGCKLNMFNTVKNGNDTEKT